MSVITSSFPPTSVAGRAPLLGARPDLYCRFRLRLLARAQAAALIAIHDSPRDRAGRAAERMSEFVGERGVTAMAITPVTVHALRHLQVRPEYAALEAWLRGYGRREWALNQGDGE